MPSIKQIIAEIQASDTLPPSHKVKVVQIIRDAEERLKLKVTSQPRKVKNAKGLVTLEEWEVAHGRLGIDHVIAWVNATKLCPRMIAAMIDEFRREMMAKGKQYANFKMAFQTYLGKGWLSKPITLCTLERSEFKSQTFIQTKGVSL